MDSNFDMMHENYIVRFVCLGGLFTSIVSPDLLEVYVVPKEYTTLSKKLKINCHFTQMQKHIGYSFSWAKMLKNHYTKIRQVHFGFH
jgi:hypothetical protein